MKGHSTGVAKPGQPSDETSTARDRTSLEIEIDGTAGVVRVCDLELFEPSRRFYARELLEALCDHAGVRRAEIDLPSSTCRVDFDLGSSTPAAMADVFVAALRSASARVGRPRWWQRTPRWSTLTAYRSDGAVSCWETHADAPERVRLLHRGDTRDRAASTRVADRLARLDGVDHCRVSLWSHRITVHGKPLGGSWASRTVDRAERILEGRSFDALHQSDRALDAAPSTNGPAAPLATPWSRLRHGALAGGAFTMTLIGLVVPGVPTVPFLLATSYYLARSSPRMNDRLRRTAFFGAILQEWEGNAALSVGSKAKLMGLTLTIVVVTVVLMPLTPVALSVILVISSLSVYGLARLPALEHDMSQESWTPLALPAR